MTWLQRSSQPRARWCWAANIDPVPSFAMEHLKTCEKTSELLRSVEPLKNFFISSGCDLPSGVPVQNLDAFYENGEGFSIDSVHFDHDPA